MSLISGMICGVPGPFDHRGFCIFVRPVLVRSVQDANANHHQRRSLRHAARNQPMCCSNRCDTEAKGND
jgi:hypothetical protein